MDPDVNVGSTQTVEATTKATVSPTSTASVLLPSATPGAATPVIPDAQPGVLILSLQEGLDTHLFAYRPLAEQTENILPLTRLTNGPWHDIAPALSPDGLQIAFASNRDGQWDIYLWGVETGQINRLTHTPGYESSPTWSPDSTWLAYTRYIDNNLELVIDQIIENDDPIQLTQHLAADHSPAWSPLGRQIAFVSTRGGRNQIWLANLDQSSEQRFHLLSAPSELTAQYPAWSPDGRYLAWSAVTNWGLHQLMVWDSDNAHIAPQAHGSGDRPAWSLDGRTLYTTFETPYQTYLMGYPFDQPDAIILPPVALPGIVDGLLWANVSLSALLPDSGLPAPTPLSDPVVVLNPDAPGGRWSLVPLDTIEAPFAQLHDRVDDSFLALQTHLAAKIGWDALANLENAFVPLTSMLSPGQRRDWLYTGRAFALNTLPINAGWMTVVREDYGPETFWRVYLRVRFQDGSSGRPLVNIPWNFDARYRAEPRPYEQGGDFAQTVPPGYWVDLTSLAAAYGWQRLSALSSWRSVYTAARFNEFFRSDDLTWEEAMLEIYPPEVLLTPTAIATGTPTSTATLFGGRSPTPAISATPTPTLAVSPIETSTPTP